MNTSIDYQPQSIMIKTDDEGDVTFEAMVAVGTGLACHRHYYGQGKFRKTYGVTIISTGLSVNAQQQFPTVDAAKHFIELLTHITDWNRPEEDLKTLDLKVIKPLVLGAYRQALEDCEVAS